MKYLVMGTGSIGETHIQNLKEITKGEIIACDLDKKRLDFIKDKYKIQGFSDIDISFEQNPDIILVCTPPNSHIPFRPLHWKNYIDKNEQVVCVVTYDGKENVIKNK